MIIFHEGLPRQGKSYEALAKQILPALEKGRKVFSNIKGLNHDKIAAYLGISLERCQQLLIQLDDEQMPTVYNHVENDSLVVLDELQNFFPSSRNSLSQEMTVFVTEHGHRGIDIVAIGQDHRDCHALWKRRIDQLITFVKRDAIGKPDEYLWTTFKQRGGKFEKLRSGTAVYDSRYFGMYKSHDDGVQNKATHEDDRTNILKGNFFRLYVPIFLAVLVAALYYLYTLFTGGVSISGKEQIKPPTAIQSPQLTQFAKGQGGDASPSTAIKINPPPPPVEKTPESFLQKNLEKYRPRLVGLIENKAKTKIVAWVEFVDDSNRVYERFNIPQLQAFGYTVERKEYGLLLIRNDKQYPVTQFPIDRTRGVTTANESAKPSAVPVQARVQSPMPF